MAIKSKQELKTYFETGDVPTQNQFEHLIDSSLAKRGYLDFTGRFYFYTDNRWIGTNPNHGQSSDNFNYNHGTSELPNVRWNSLGIGFLPKGTILHSLEFIGRVNNAQVEKIQTQLSYQGNKFDEGGYSNVQEAENKVILSPHTLEPHAPDFTYMQRHAIDLDGFELETDGIIEFCCKPLGELTSTRYWTAQRKLHFTTP
jgi:hypothetical protein